MTVYDYSFARPDPAVLGEGVMRYLAVVNAQTRGKVLSSSELDALHAAGKPVGLVYEASADPSTWDGAEALRQAQALGFPDHRPIYFAADRAIGRDEWDTVAGLLDATVVPVARRGLYAGAPLVQAMLDQGHIAWGWIAGALSWSMSPPYSVDRAVAMSPGSHLVQLVGSDVPGTDANTALKPDWGGWHPLIDTQPAPAARPSKELHMPLDRLFVDSRQGVWVASGDINGTRRHVPDMTQLSYVIALHKEAFAVNGVGTLLCQADGTPIVRGVGDDYLGLYMDVTPNGTTPTSITANDITAIAQASADKTLAELGQKIVG